MLHTHSTLRIQMRSHFRWM